jgi:poly-gamma-glutamate capsule biosynthesis protein CapA/YwtB (metallophosphatase superfamily)
MKRWLWLVALVGCDDGGGGGEAADSAVAVDAAADAGDPYAAWPDPEAVFPYVYTPEEGLPAYAHTRWETETWPINGPEAALYLRKLLSHYTTAPTEVVQHFQATGAAIPRLGEGLTLSLAGDILWLGDNWSSFAEGVADLTTADLRIANLETAASPLHPPGKSGLPVRFNAPVEIFDGLPFDVLQLNNNHTLDADDSGAVATQAEAEARGYTTTGLDRHATVTVEGQKIALLSYTWGVNRRDITSAHELFIIPFGHIGEDIDLSSMEAHIQAARADGAAFVVVLLHWGYEFEYFPDPHFLVLARRMVALGADVVSGQGPHVVQPAELCQVNRPEVVPGVGTCSVRTADGQPRTAAILYSLGNFTNDVKDRIEIETGIIARVSLQVGTGVTGLDWTPIVLRHDPPRVEPVADHLDDPEVAGESMRLDTHLGAGWRR